MEEKLKEAKEEIRGWALGLGVARCGIAKAEPINADDSMLYSQWIQGRMHASMDYCAKYDDVRHDPRLLLEGANTVISCAFNYNAPVTSHIIASYALGQDYHYVIKQRLRELGECIKANYGGEYRAVVDTAPMRERYWAVKSGIGFTGLNGQLIVDGIGSYVFLGELICTLELEPDSPSTATCMKCRRCIEACPGKALDGTGRCDARKCVSFLTIENREEIPAEANLGGMIYGCDACQKVCPHNHCAPSTSIEEFQADPEILNLTKEEMLTMTSSHYKRLTAHSAMRRASFMQMRRNAAHPDRKY